MISNASVSSFLSLQLAEFDDRSTSGNHWHSSNDVEMTTTVSLGEDDHEIPPQRRNESTIMVGEFVHFPCSPPYAVISSCKRTSPIAAQPQERPITLPDLSISPLTASSYHTMERHYNQDTWRLHTRINAARSHRQIGRTSTGFDSCHGLLLNGTDSIGDHQTSTVAASDLSYRRALVLEDFLTSLSGRLIAISNSANNSDGEMEHEDEDALCIFELDLGES